MHLSGSSMVGGKASKVTSGLLTGGKFLHTNQVMKTTSQLGNCLTTKSIHSESKNILSAIKYCPLYSAKSTRNYTSLIGSKPWVCSTIQSRQMANTTSGIFAPTTLVNNQRSIGVKSNLNVFDDSDHLPRLPVPALSETLEKLKESISPLAMNSTEFAQTLDLIDEFSKSAGPKLDLLLRAKSKQTKNWLTHDWWADQIYLKSRKPLVINSNPGMIFPTFPFEVNNQRVLLNTTAQLISGIIDFKLSLIHGYNPEAINPDNETGLDPNLCYNQYQNMFGCTRVPGSPMDTQKRLANCTQSSPFSVVLSFKGRFFEIQLENVEDEKSRIDKLTGILDKIVNSSNINNEESADDLVGAGVLTASDRDKWANSYKLMDADSINAIEQSQFVVCIDTIRDQPDQSQSSALSKSQIGAENHLAALSRQVLHADELNIGNRWFDKAFQLIIVADENAERLLGAGINYEHSFSEAMVVTKMIEFSYDKTVHNHRDLSSGNNFFARQQIRGSNDPPATFRQLPMFDVNHVESISNHLYQAKQDFKSQLGQFDMSYMRYKHYGSNSIKSWRFSPDSWFQVALQLAYHNVHKRLGPCYESASTRRFAYGRTETIRSLTQQVAQFCLEPRLETLQWAVKSHKAYSLAANYANAIDRPLMGYRMVFNQLRTNSWPWGLPTIGELSEANITRDEHSVDSFSELLSNESLKELRDPNNESQKFKLDDVFTEEELTTISAFFNSALINRSSRFALSTSQVSSSHPDICMSYGPLLTDGYGCCYNITGQQIVAAISANSSNQSFSCKVDKLNSGLKSSLDMMRDIVEEQR